MIFIIKIYLILKMTSLKCNDIILPLDNKSNDQLNEKNNTKQKKTKLNTNNVTFNLVVKNSNDHSLQNPISEKSFNNQFIKITSKDNSLIKKELKIKKTLNIHLKSNDLKAPNNLYAQKKIDTVIFTNNNRISNSNEDKYSTVRITSKNSKKKQFIINNSIKKSNKKTGNLTKSEKKKTNLIHSLNSKNAKSDFTLHKKSFGCIKNNGDKINNLSSFSLIKNTINNKKNLSTSIKQNKTNEKNSEINLYKENNNRVSYTLHYKRKKTNNNVKNLKNNNIVLCHSSTKNGESQITKNITHKKIIRSKNNDKKCNISTNKTQTKREEFSESSHKIKNNLRIINENCTTLKENKASKKLKTLENHNNKKKLKKKNIVINKRKLYTDENKSNEDSFLFCDMDSENKNKINIIKINEFDINKPKDKNLKYTLYKEFEDETNEEKSENNSKIHNVIIGKIDAYKDIVESDKLNTIYYAQRLKNFFGLYNIKHDKKMKNQNNSEKNRILSNKIENDTLTLDVNLNNEIEDLDSYNNYNDLCLKNKDETNSNTILLPVQVSKISHCKYFDKNAESHKCKEKGNNIVYNKINKKYHNILINKKKFPEKFIKTSLEKKDELSKQISSNSKNSVINSNDFRKKRIQIKNNRNHNNNFNYVTNECPRLGEIKLVEINCEDDSKNYYYINSDENTKKNDIIFDDSLVNKKNVVNLKTVSGECIKNINKKRQIKLNQGNEEKCIVF